MEFDEEESKQMMAGVSIIIIDQSQSSILIIDQSQVSMDSENSDNWWDTVDLTKLILACNKISSISPKVTRSTSLQRAYI